MQSLRGLQPTSNQSESQTKPPVSQNKPSESQTNTLSTVTPTGDASKIHKVNDDEDSEATPPPQTPSPQKDTSPQKSIFYVSPNTLKLVALPEADQSKPASPPPSVTKTPSENQPTPEPEQQPRQQLNLEPNSTIIIHRPDPTDEIHHVDMDNTFTLNQPNNQHLQEISRTLELEQADKSPSHSSALNNIMDDYSHECIYVPPHLPAKILNQPINTTQDDIELLLKAVNKNIRRLNIAIPKIYVDSAHIDQECDLMQTGVHDMIEAVREAYKKDLEFRKELARLEAERIEREKREAEERERKRLEDERIEKERKEAEEREQARLAGEARIAAEQARLAEFARNAPTFALQMRED
ncbi:hypothetical protein QL285_082577 [Trifolium repens]|nr:hypothetical protein QL285_082577 [Trifolium repens]